jgi:predicted nucleic acid-binding protein
MGKGVNGAALLDNSAWARLAHSGLSAGRVEHLAGALEAGQLVASLPFVLEAGYSARSAADHDRLLAELCALPWAHVDEVTERRALDAQRQLARVGHHRLAPVDVLTSALADRHGHGVLHYDADYEVIAARTDLVFDSVWLAERGSL